MKFSLSLKDYSFSNAKKPKQRDVGFSSFSRIDYNSTPVHVQWQSIIKPHPSF